MLLNSSPFMQSAYTRSDPSDPDNDSKKSVLDLIIMSRNLLKYVDNVVIDNDRKFTPSHTLKKNGRMIYPDHYAILMTMKGIPLKKQKQKRVPKILMWNTNKEGGWKKYNELTSNNHVLNRIASGSVDDSHPDTIAKQIDKELTKVKFKSFGKVKYRKGTQQNKALEDLYARKRKCNKASEICEIDDAINKELEEERKEKLLNEMNSLTKIKNNRGNVAAVFKLKEAVVGSKKPSQEATTLRDPISNLVVDSVSEIKRVSLAYCKELLTNRLPNQGFENTLKMKSEIHDKRMEEFLKDYEFDLTNQMFSDALVRVQRKNPKKYSFILKGGQSLKDSLFFLFQCVWAKEVIPEDWKKTNIVQIHKGKSSLDDITGYRNIHTKIDTRKLFGEMVTHELKAKIKENISKFQIGAIPGHRPQEHLFTIKSTIAAYNKRGKGIILCLYDVSRFFDRENLRDCCGELYKLDIKGKMYRLAFILNKDTEIRVRTPVGYTDSSDVGETLGQGTSESGLISSGSLSGGVTEYFTGSNEVHYASLKLGCCLFQDDIARMAEDLKNVEDGNRRLEAMAESKLLDYNAGKTGMIIIGPKKFRKKIKEEQMKNPVLFCGKPMQIFEQERYLGEILGSNLSESVFLTIHQRKGLVQRLISEIRVVINDCRSDGIGGLLVGLEIWRKAVIPFLFNNSGSWVETPKKALNLLNFLTHAFFRTLFCSPKGTPIVMFFWDTGTLLNENFLILQKLLLLHHIVSLSNNCLAKEVLLLQSEEEELPGLLKDCELHLQQLGIQSDPSSFTKPQWRKKIQYHIHLKNKTDLITQINSHKKLDKVKLSSESYGIKQYISTMKVSEARTFFASRSMMLSTVQYNFKNNPKYKANEYKCKCGDTDTQSNLLTCKLYRHLREGLDLSNSDTDLVRYFQLVIQERQEEQEQGQ